MKIRKSFEQAICILLLIGAHEKPIKSHELSEKLLVSDSYLKKSPDNWLLLVLLHLWLTNVVVLL